jgi:hypothetical protein
MTIFVCNGCGRFYNSDTLKQCPSCQAPRIEQNDLAKELGKGFSEAQEIIIKELARQVASEKVREHEESGYHA